MNVIKDLKIICWPMLNILALSLPVYLFTQQSFLKFGELTTASVMLTLITGFLPITLLVSLFFAFKIMKGNKQTRRDFVALLMLTQLCAVWFYWNVIPVIFWK